MIKPWRCILCSSPNLSSGKWVREATLCRKCHSTWRARAVCYGVLLGLGYPPKPILKIKSDYSRIGLGISDDIKIASTLSQAFHYSNSFFDAFPYLDIRNVPNIAKGYFEFVTFSDVLEHVDVKVNEALTGLFDLLKPNGFAVISVPISEEDDHREFYPDLVDFEIKEGQIKWTNSKGKQFLDKNPEFHGGRGQNLAFRRFSSSSIVEAISEAGFRVVNQIPDCGRLGAPSIPFSGVYLARK